MTENESHDPEQLERFLSNRDGNPDFNPEQLQPRHLVAIATTTENGLESLDDDFDWERLLTILAELNSSEESRWLRRLTRNLGTRTTSGIESEKGIQALGDRSYHLRHDNPEVFLTYLDEIQSLLRYDTSAVGIEAAEEEFRRLAEMGDRESDQRVASFREQDLEQRLVDPNLGAESRVSLLETLAAESIGEVEPTMVVDTLYPLRNHYDARVEKAALSAYERWSKQLLRNQSTSDIIGLLEEDLANEVTDLPHSVLNGIIISGYVGPAIVDWLVELPNIESKQDVVEAAFETLREIPGIRDSIEPICEFLLEDVQEKDAIHAGIEVLESVLIGLEPHQNTETPAHSDHIQSVFFTQEELSIDKTIRTTLQTIVESESYPDDVRAHAARSWLSVRPPEIERLLWDIDLEEIGENPVVDAKLEAATEHRLIEFVDVIEDLWAEAEGYPDKQSQLVDSLEQLESREIVDVLLDPAFDSDADKIRQAAREALKESGYESEIERESQRRTVNERISTRFDAMSKATEIDREIRDRGKEQTSTEQERKQAGVKVAEATSKSVDNLAEFRSQGATQMLKLAPLFDQLKELEREIEDLMHHIQSLVDEIESERDEAKRLEREIKSVESDIDDTERKLEDAKQRKRKVQNRIRELENDTIPSIEKDIRSTEREYSKVDSREPQRRDFTGENSDERYRRKHNDWKRELRNLEDEISRLESKKQEAKNELYELENEQDSLERDIKEYNDKLRSLRENHRNLVSELDDSIRRIDGYERRLKDRQQELQQLRDEYEQLQSQVDTIVQRLSGIRDSAQSRDIELKNRSEKHRSRISSLRQRLESLNEAQTDAIQLRERQRSRVEDLTTQLDIDHDELENLGEKTKTEVPAADEEAVDKAEHTRTEQYEQNEDSWRLDSIFQRVFEADRIDDLNEDLAHRTETRADGGETR